MPRPARPWFRFYSEALESRKAQRLKPALFKHWVNLLCLANISKPRGRLPCLADIAYAFRPMSEPAVAAVLATFASLGFIDPEDDGFVMHDWDEWQKDSDVAAERMANKRRTSSEQQPNMFGVEKRREEREKEGEKEREKEQTLAFVPNLNSPWPVEAGFVGEYRKHFEARAGDLCPTTQLVDAAQLERDFGTEVCVQVATDSEWSKPPNWLRKKLEGQRANTGRASSSDPAEAELAKRVADGVRRLG